MTSVDDIATPMEMMMENTKNSTLQEGSFFTPDKRPTDAPSSPVVRGFMRLSQSMAQQASDPQNSPLTSLIANNTESPERIPSVSFPSNPITPSPRSSYRSNKRRSSSSRKPTVPLNISLANRPTKAWLARHGQLPGQKDARLPPSSSPWNNSNGKRTGDSLFPNHNITTKRHKKWHCTVPVESVPNRPTKSWLAKVEASRTIQDRLEQQRQQGLGFDAPCPYFQSNHTLQTPNGQFFHYGDHQYP